MNEIEYLELGTFNPYRFSKLALRLGNFLEAMPKLINSLNDKLANIVLSDQKRDKDSRFMAVEILHANFRMRDFQIYFMIELRIDTSGFDEGALISETTTLYLRSSLLDKDERDPLSFFLKFLTSSELIEDASAFKIFELIRNNVEGNHLSIAVTGLNTRNYLLKIEHERKTVLSSLTELLRLRLVAATGSSQNIFGKYFSNANSVGLELERFGETIGFKSHYPIDQQANRMPGAITPYEPLIIGNLGHDLDSLFQALMDAIMVTVGYGLIQEQDNLEDIKTIWLTVIDRVAMKVVTDHAVGVKKLEESKQSGRL